MLKLVRILAWTLVAGLVVVTLSPIGLRPVVVGSADLERALAYALLGGLLGLAHPRRPLFAAAVGVMVAAGLEAAQLLTETRHGRAMDFLVKALSAGAGVMLARAALTLLAFRQRRRV